MFRRFGRQTESSKHVQKAAVIEWGRSLTSDLVVKKKLHLTCSGAALNMSVYYLYVLKYLNSFLLNFLQYTGSISVNTLQQTNIFSINRK